MRESPAGARLVPKTATHEPVDIAPPVIKLASFTMELIVGTAAEGPVAQFWPVYEKCGIARSSIACKTRVAFEAANAAGDGSPAGSVPLVESKLPGRLSSERPPPTEAPSVGGGLGRGERAPSPVIKMVVTVPIPGNISTEN
jgi:hypothetical protein